jgi:hypothetical protein
LNREQNSSVLHCEGLRKRFGEIEAVRGVSFEIAPKRLRRPSQWSTEEFCSLFNSPVRTIVIEWCG